MIVVYCIVGDKDEALFVAIDMFTSANALSRWLDNAIRTTAERNDEFMIWLDCWIIYLLWCVTLFAILNWKANQNFLQAMTARCFGPICRVLISMNHVSLQTFSISSLRSMQKSNEMTIYLRWKLQMDIRCLTLKSSRSYSRPANKRHWAKSDTNTTNSSTRFCDRLVHPPSKVVIYECTLGRVRKD